jgi:hypothetical protein
MSRDITRCYKSSDPHSLRRIDGHLLASLIGRTLGVPSRNVLPIWLFSCNARRFAAILGPHPMAQQFRRQHHPVRMRITEQRFKRRLRSSNVL